MSQNSETYLGIRGTWSTNVKTLFLWENWDESFLVISKKYESFDSLLLSTDVIMIAWTPCTVTETPETEVSYLLIDY